MTATSRVLVVDDSAFMRKILCDLIALDPQFVVIGTANNGREAIEAVRVNQPDVITMDLEMPEMNGLEALERIMRIHPTPIIMLSSISDDGTRETIRALQNGAFDFIRKPSGPNSPDIQMVGEQLLEKLRIAVLTKRHSSLYQQVSAPAPRKPAVPKQKESFTFDTAAMPKSSRRSDTANSSKETYDQAAMNETAASSSKQVEPSKPATTQGLNKSAAKKEKLQPAPEQTVQSDSDVPAKNTSKPAPNRNFRHLVAIGTSTGGPRALHEVITALPADFPAPVLVVQHMPPKFTHSLAQRLDSFSALHVTEAVQGERVFAGVVYIAPGGFHMELAKDRDGYCIKLSDEAPRGGHRPSVDTMFESCAAFTELRRHSVIMTGMGSDGMKGMRVMNDSGAESAIAEAEESCVVYGMPRSAIEAGVAKSVVNLRQIATAITQAVRK
ncbi:chemotaxis response regulator protein-glutamate methylesterase [Paenibacillus sp. OV219]|uniref:protein-glutamate methylesterase/protein-glutamine glutaminase n=1 Tax=Paenibacillus sp. OV219 TaxID=1884377 RepID=UPI0008C89FEB|nr:chemotaxis response regulator protein-glutamate methylesterase [Paenibacillus sp. OV219]SEN32706.1 two-component system, chemotaxis family, response regulator CheB [Paenibacillus sp. OV219]